MQRILSLISNYSPLRGLVNFILERLIGNFIKSDVNFGNIGISKLVSLELNEERINRMFLKSSPLVIESGSIGSFSLNIPWSNLLTKNITIDIENLFLKLRSNENVVVRKEDATEMIQQGLKEEMDRLDDDNIDVFKKMIKKILSNIEINFRSVAVQIQVDVYEEKNISKSKTNQFFFLAKLDSIKLSQKTEENKTVAATSEEKTKLSKVVSEKNSFLLNASGFSIHLTSSQEINPSEFSNADPTKKFPFTYPDIYHPSTILVMANEGSCVQFQFEIEKIEHKMSIGSLSIPSVELTLDPVQLKMLLFFFENFSNSMPPPTQTCVEKETKKFEPSKLSPLQEETVQKNEECDLFLSIERYESFREEDDRIIKRSKINQKEYSGVSQIINDYFDEKKATFNEQDKSQEKGEGKDTNELDIKNFKKILEDTKGELNEQQKEDILEVVKLSASVKIIRMNVLKKYENLQNEYKRYWLKTLDKENKLFNNKIASNHFTVTVKGIDLNLMDNVPNLSFNMKLRNFKFAEVSIVEDRNQVQPLKKIEISEESSIFYSHIKSIDENLFYSAKESITRSFLKERKLNSKLVEWSLNPEKQHFCITPIFKFQRKGLKSSKDSRKETITHKGVLDFVETIEHNLYFSKYENQDPEASGRESAISLSIETATEIQRRPQINISLSPAILHIGKTEIKEIKALFEVDFPTNRAEQSIKQMLFKSFNNNEVPETQKQSSSQQQPSSQLQPSNQQQLSINLDLDFLRIIVSADNISDRCLCECVHLEETEYRRDSLIAELKRASIKSSLGLKSEFQIKFKSLMLGAIEKKNNCLHLQKLFESENKLDLMAISKERANGNIIISLKQPKLAELDKNEAKHFSQKTFFDSKKSSSSFASLNNVMFLKRKTRRQFYTDLINKRKIASSIGRVDINIEYVKVFLELGALKTLKNLGENMQSAFNGNSSFQKARREGYTEPREGCTEPREGNSEPREGPSKTNTNVEIKIYKAQIFLITSKMSQDKIQPNLGPHFLFNVEEHKKNLSRALQLILKYVVVCVLSDDNFSSTLSSIICINDLVVLDPKVEKPDFGAPVVNENIVKSSEIEAKQIPTEENNNILENEAVQSILIYKQSYFRSYTSKQEFLTREKTIFYEIDNFLNISFCKISVGNLGSEIKCEGSLLGAVVRPYLQFSSVSEVKAAFEEFLSNDMSENAANQINSNSDSTRTLFLSLEFCIEQIVLDIFPYYNSDIVIKNKNSNAFHVTEDVIIRDSKTYYYSRTRSLLSFEHIGLSLDYSTSENDSLVIRLQVQDFKYFFVKLPYFNVLQNIPILLLNKSAELSKFLGGYLEKLGFIVLLDIDHAKVDYTRNGKTLTVLLETVSVNFCKDSLYSFIGHIQNINYLVSPDDTQIKVLPASAVKEHPVEKSSIQKFDIDLSAFADEVSLKRDLSSDSSDKFEIIDNEEEIMNEDMADKECVDSANAFLHAATNNPQIYERKTNPNDFLMQCSINLLLISLYSGLDFDFYVWEESEISFASKRIVEKRRELQVSNFYADAGNGNIKIMHEHFGSLEDSIFSGSKSQARKKEEPDDYLVKRNGKRDLQNCVRLVAEKFGATWLECQRNPEKIKGNHSVSDVRKSELVRLNVSLGNLEILDQLKDSKNKKILCFGGQGNCIFLLVRISEALKGEGKEVEFFGKLNDMRIYANAVNFDYLYEFLKYKRTVHIAKINKSQDVYYEPTEEDFLDKTLDPLGLSRKKSKRPTRSATKDPNGSNGLFINVFFFNELNIKIDYDSSFSHLIKIKDDIFEIRNLGSITDLRISLKNLIFRGLNLEELIECVFETWSRDIKLHQLPQIFSKLPYVNNLFNVFKGFYDLIYLPYRNYVQEGSVKKGLNDGISSFLTAMSKESLNLAEGVSNTIFQGMNLLSSGNRVSRVSYFSTLLEEARFQLDPAERVKKDEKYKRN